LFVEAVERNIATTNMVLMRKKKKKKKERKSEGLF